MGFSYRWSNQAKGNYAIRKKDAGRKGEKDFAEAGKGIEKKDKTHASATHFFLDLDDETRFLELPKINAILRTINYEYIYEGSGEKSSRQYLTKQDLETVFNDPKKHENKTVRIRIAPPKTERKTKSREKAATLKLFREYLDSREGIWEGGRETLFDLVAKKEAKKKELAKKRMNAKARILKWSLPDYVNIVKRPYPV